MKKLKGRLFGRGVALVGEKEFIHCHITERISDAGLFDDAVEGQLFPAIEGSGSNDCIVFGGVRCPCFRGVEHGTNIVDNYVPEEEHFTAYFTVKVLCACEDMSPQELYDEVMKMDLSLDSEV